MFLAGQEIKNPLASELASVFDLLTLVSINDSTVQNKVANTRAVTYFIRCVVPPRFSYGFLQRVHRIYASN